MPTSVWLAQDWVARSGREGSEAGKTLGKPGEPLLHIWMGLQGLLGLLAGTALKEQPGIATLHLGPDLASALLH